MHAYAFSRTERRTRRAREGGGEIDRQEEFLSKVKKDRRMERTEDGKIAVCMIKRDGDVIVLRDRKAGW